MKYDIFPGWEGFFSFPSFVFVLPEERVQNLQGRTDVLRDNICRTIHEQFVSEYQALSASAEPPRQQEREGAFNNASS